MGARQIRSCMTRVCVRSVAVVVALAATSSAAVPVPTLSGPILGPGVPFVTPPSLDVTPFGFLEEEFFVSGTATGFTNAGTLESDGKWGAAPNGSAGYVTRMLVRRPADRRRFNGTVIVEWLNVSGGLDAGPDWTYLHTLILRTGMAWIGVSMQAVGVVGGSSPLGLNLSLKAVNPVRYGPLVHPGDAFSYDMFSQVGQAVRVPIGAALLGDLVPKRVIGVGESQSAFRLVTYVNAVHPLAHVYDGFLIHSRGGTGAPLSQAPLDPVATPSPAFIRTDVDVPVLTFETETDMVSLGFFAARQPDSDNIRTWEVAGTAHADTYQLAAGPNDPGPAAFDTTYLAPVTSVFGVITCSSPINSGPQQFVLISAMAQLERWVRSGKPARRQPRLDVSAPPVTINRDAYGNALGGIRTPAVDVPIATYSGLGQTGSAFCGLFGTTAPLDGATLASLYPDHKTYVKKIRKALRAAKRTGAVTPVDAKGILAAAQASTVGN